MMKRILFAAAMAVAAVPASAADVGVSISVGQPGFYGRIDIGQFPQPVLVYPEPLIIQPGPYGVLRRPIYLRVPPGHARDWGKHCHKYNACAQPVYFVQERWYTDVYAPRYRESRRLREQPRFDRRDGAHYRRDARPDARRHEPPRARGPERNRGGDKGNGRGRGRD